MISTIIIGAISGWLGSQIWKGSSLGLLGNIIIGVLGSIVGYKLLHLLGIHLRKGLVGSILTGAAGAIVILALANYLSSNKK